MERIQAMTEPTEVRDAVRIERMVNAPVDLVWRLWTEPAHFAQWYGPDGATVDVEEMDVRVGGNRFVAMQVETPARPRRMWFTGEHREVVVGRRLVYTEAIADEHGTVLTPAQMGMPDDHPVTTEITVELEDVAGRTRVVLTHLGVPADSPGAAGWTMAFDKLAQLAETA
jgi:uncharacterized protein YndB with AHSA1/START domain